MPGSNPISFNTRTPFSPGIQGLHVVGNVTRRQHMHPGLDGHTRDLGVHECRSMLMTKSADAMRASRSAASVTDI